MGGGQRPLRERIAELRVFEDGRSRRRFLLHLAVVVLILVAIAVAARQYAPLFTRPRELRLIIREFGVAGPLVLVGLQAAQVVLAPVPGQVLAVVAGYLYGAWWGTLFNMLGIAIGSTVAFSLSRRYGRPYVEGIVHEDLLARFDAVDDTHARLVLFLVFLIPGLPDDLLCFVGGLTRIPLWQLVAIAIVGRAPAFFLVNVIGESVAAGQDGLALALVAVVVGLSYLGYRYRGWLLDRLGV